MLLLANGENRRSHCQSPISYSWYVWRVVRTQRTTETQCRTLFSINWHWSETQISIVHSWAKQKLTEDPLKDSHRDCWYNVCVLLKITVSIPTCLKVHPRQLLNPAGYTCSKVTDTFSKTWPINSSPVNRTRRLTKLGQVVGPAGAGLASLSPIPEVLAPFGLTGSFWNPWLCNTYPNTPDLGNKSCLRFIQAAAVKAKGMGRNHAWILTKMELFIRGAMLEHKYQFPLEMLATVVILSFIHTLE